jgi:thiol-disulfide isomerase/thioredoxin
VLKNKSHTLFLLVLIVLVASAGWFTYKNYLEKKLDEQQDPAFATLLDQESQNYTDITGNTVSVDANDEVYLLVYNWATWSPSSQHDFGILGDLRDEIANADMRVVAINRSEPQETAQAFLNQFPVTDGIQIVLDSDDQFYENIGGFSMPETIIFNERGEIIYRKHGRLSKDSILEQLHTMESIDE